MSRQGRGSLSRASRISVTRSCSFSLVRALLCCWVLRVPIIAAMMGLLPHLAHASQKTMPASLPRLSILFEGAIFLVTLAVAGAVFPRMWHRPFGQVLNWNSAVARTHFWRLAVGGVLLSIVAQLLESRLTLPKEMPIDAFFRSPADVWIVALFGTFVAPVCEEIFFRGFLLRGIAIAYDWLTTPKTEAGHVWRVGTDALSSRALIVAGVLSSGLFAAMHAAQLGFAWNAVALLWLVGGALTVVRIRLNSVAASSVLHAVYNGWIFAVVFVVTGGFRHLERAQTH